MKKYLPFIVSIFILIVCAIIVYFGRIHFPENFDPNNVSFFENYYALVFGGCIVILSFSFIIFGLVFIINQLISLIKL